MLLAHEIITRMDEDQDNKLLSNAETWLHRKLKCAYLGLASLKRSLVR